MSRNTKNILLVAMVVVAASIYEAVRNRSGAPAPVAVEKSSGGGAVANAYKHRLRGVQVRGVGTVYRILSDDNEGSRHQRFILRLASGQTLLVAHNIDLAPRIGNLRVGDTVEYSGEYEWNSRGGVLHWTHRDPAARHPGGWLRHNGRTYE